MKLSIFGTGYVGLVTGVCFAEMGNDVICMDLDESKINMLKDGKSPIYEPGLDDLLEENIKAKRLNFTTDYPKSVATSEVLFIAVGTPPNEDGSADLKYVLAVAESIAKHMDKYKLIVTKSTVPVGTNYKVKEVVSKTLKTRGLNIDFDICSNPEFLREGVAIQDCLKANRVVIGVETERAEKVMKDLYEPFLKGGNPLVVMDVVSSEMTKYAANAMLAAKISLMNEFSRLCEKVGADIEHVRRGIGTDHRIGPYSIYAGVGYGGSCFPKDVQALIRIGDENNEPLEILRAVEDGNQKQKLNFYSKIERKFSSFEGKAFAFWGGAFKPGTDDIREAPSLFLIERILKKGGVVFLYDPVADKNILDYFTNVNLVGAEVAGFAKKNLKASEDQYQVLEGADALVIPTEWKSFKEPDFSRMKSLMRQNIIFDGRNMYSVSRMQENGFEYYSIGRKS